MEDHEKGNPLLDYLSRLTPEERQENARKAGKASGEARRRYKRFKDVVQELLVLPPTDPRIKDKLTALGVAPTNSNAVALAQILGALDGSTDSARWVRDTAGDKPTDQMSMDITSKPIKSLDLTTLTDSELETLADSETP